MGGGLLFLGYWNDSGRQRTDDGGRRAEDGGRRAEDGGRRAEGRMLIADADIPFQPKAVLGNYDIINRES